MEREILATNRKALRLNLNKSIFGTFAEIGGGQEVSREFFQAGGASGTVAKTISAYDKSFSDALYNNNQAGRYVSEGRLVKMLDKEYSDLCEVISSKRQIETLHFVFANTVTTLNYKKNNVSHGWLGVKFQLHPEAEPNQITLHVNLHEQNALLQQSSLGALGVNFLFACYYFYDRPNSFLQSLLDSLSTDRVEITMIRMSGPDLAYVDNRLLAVQLVKNEMTRAIMFDRYSEVQQPTDMLYKKNVLAFRGSFRPITYVGFDMLKSSYSIFKRDEDYDKYNTISLCEMTMNNLLEQGNFDERDFLDRVDILNGMGQNVMVSNFREYYKLVDYFSQFQIINLRIVIGVLTWIKVLDEKFYTDLKGGVLEALGKLFPKNVKLYIYPALKKSGGELLTSKNIYLSEDIQYLYSYLQYHRMILDITNVNHKKLHIFSIRVLEMIKNGEEGWEEMVPAYISKQIKKKKIFGYKELN